MLDLAHQPVDFRLAEPRRRAIGIAQGRRAALPGRAAGRVVVVDDGRNIIGQRRIELFVLLFLLGLLGGRLALALLFLALLALGFGRGELLTFLEAL